MPVLVIAAGGSLAVADPSQAPLRIEDARVAAVAFRIGRAARAWCDAPTRAAGWQLHFLDDYDASLRADLIAAFAMDRGPNLLATVPDGPAARAGLRVGDTIVAANGAPFADPDRLAAETLLDRALAIGPARLAILRGGDRIDLTVDGVPACPAIVRVVPIDRRNAFADGRHVLVSTGIVDLARDDAELAALLAHELAHNYLHHGVATAVAPPLPQLRAEEAAADRFSLTLMAAAGYDLAASPRFWSRLLRDSPRVRAGYGDHAPRRERLKALEQEIARIRAAPTLVRNGVTAPKR